MEFYYTLHSSIHTKKSDSSTPTMIAQFVNGRYSFDIGSDLLSCTTLHENLEQGSPTFFPQRATFTK